MTATGGILAPVVGAINSVKVETTGYDISEVVDMAEGTKCYLLDTAMAIALPEAALHQHQS